jgi:hypothetical protein
VHAVANDGYTALHIAAADGRGPMTKLLVELGADLHAQLPDGRMALHLAVDNMEAVKLLVELGADVHAKDNKGQTALQLAKVAKHAAVVAMLQHEMDKPRRELSQPKSVLAGVFLQYTVMPALGYYIGMALNLASPLRVGLVLVACCPGGTASNLVTFLARANTALSVVLTTISTGLAVFLTPLVTKVAVGPH